MSVRLMLLSTSFALCVASTAALPVLAESADVSQQIATSKYTFQGVVNADSVYIRSGPGPAYYPIMKLDKGATVTVVGISFDWLKILPPQGSYSLIAQGLVEKHGDGSTGRVTKDEVNVRAGSAINAVQMPVQTKLNTGDEVKIIGTQAEYFKIVPPTGAYLYVSKQYVTAVKQMTTSDAPADSTDAATPPAAVQSNEPELAEPHMAVEGDNAASTRPAVAVDADSATTQPVVTAEMQFDKIEADFASAQKESLQQQPIAELLKQYQTLTQAPALPESMRRIADHRIAVLKVRAEVLADLEKTHKAREAANAHEQALEAERQEIAERQKRDEIVFYTAIGTLRTSSLQSGSQTLYRLTDPANGRTVIYIRSNDAKTAGLLGQLIGVKGQIVTDQDLQLRLITPTDIEKVDPARLNTKVTAQIIPPSLLPQASTQPDN